MSIGDFPEIMSQQILVGRLGVAYSWYRFRPDQDAPERAGDPEKHVARKRYTIEITRNGEDTSNREANANHLRIKRERERERERDADREKGRDRDRDRVRMISWTSWRATSTSSPRHPDLTTCVTRRACVCVCVLCVLWCTVLYMYVHTCDQVWHASSVAVVLD